MVCDMEVDPCYAGGDFKSGGCGVNPESDPRHMARHFYRVIFLRSVHIFT